MVMKTEIISLRFLMVGCEKTVFIHCPSLSDVNNLQCSRPNKKQGPVSLQNPRPGGHRGRGR